MMVNYYYDLEEIEANINRFDAEGHVAAGPRLARLARIATRMREEAAAKG